MSLLQRIYHSQDNAVDQHYEKIKEELFKKIENQPLEDHYDVPLAGSTRLRELLAKRFTDDGLIVSDTYCESLNKRILRFKVPVK